MSRVDEVRALEDSAILDALAIFDSEWTFTHYITRELLGKDIKSVAPHMNARLNKLTKEGLVAKRPWKCRGQEEWRLTKFRPVTPA